MVRRGIISQAAPQIESCVVVIPARNEAADVGRVVAGVRAHCDYPVVVVDDASTDGTSAAAEAAGALVIPLVTRMGAWGAIQTGLRYARRNGYAHALTMDADGQHEPASIGQLVRPVSGGGANVAIGTCIRRGSALRQVAWVLMKRASGLRLEDLTSGFRLYDKAAIELLSDRDATLLEYQDVGVLILLQRAGLRIAEVEVPMAQRRSGISRIYYSWGTVFYYMAHTLLLSLSKRHYRPQRRAV